MMEPNSSLTYMKQHLRALLIITVIATIGVGSVLLSHAATPYITSEAELGSLSAGASTISDTSASAGSAVVFSAANTDLRDIYHSHVISVTRTLYVSADGGSDANSGLSTIQAVATIQHAVDISLPGDRILVGSGTYGYLNLYGKTGNATHWLSIESVSDSVHPIINVSNNSGTDGVDIQDSSFVGLYGFEIEGLQTSASTNPSGVSIFRASSNVYVWNNTIHDFPGGGVNSFDVHSQTYNGQILPAGGWDLVDVSFNTIHDTSKYSPQNTSGISFYGGVDTTHGTLDGHYGYRAIGNYIYNVICTANSSSGQGSYGFVTDGNGISIDSLDVPWDSSLSPYIKPGLVEANVIVGVGGRAVHVFNSINVDGFFNTAVGNLRTASPAITNGVELDSNIASGNVHYAGNVILPLNTPNSTDDVSVYSNNVILGGHQSVTGTNIDHRNVAASYFHGSISAGSILTGLPITAYLPTTPDNIARQTGMTGYQALGNGTLRSNNIITAGALSP